MVNRFFKATAKISNEFYQRELTIINFLRIFGTSGIKTRKNWPIFPNVLFSSLDMGMFLRSYLFIIIAKKLNKSPSQIMFMAILHWSELGNLL